MKLLFVMILSVLFTSIQSGNIDEMTCDDNACTYHCYLHLLPGYCRTDVCYCYQQKYCLDWKCNDDCARSGKAICGFCIDLNCKCGFTEKQCKGIPHFLNQLE